MRIGDLLTDELGLQLALPVSEERLARTVTGCTQTELMTPGEWLSPGEVMLTLGMALQFHDVRTWEAYVERLLDSRISGIGFGLGPIHTELPPGLLRACERHDMPLIALPPEFPLVRLSKYIWQGLAAERYNIARDGWALADQCAQLASDGALLPELLDRVGEVVGGIVELIDSAGYSIARSHQPEPPAGSLVTRTSLNLPGTAHTRFNLQVRSIGGETMLLQPLLGPACAVIAMHLSYTLTARSPLHSHTAARFFDAVLDDRGADPAETAGLCRNAGFTPEDPWDGLVLRPLPDAPATALRQVTMRLQLVLENHYAQVRFFDEPDCATLLMQHPSGEFSLPEVVKSCLEPLAPMDAATVSRLSFDELPITVQAARRAERTEGVHPMRLIDLSSILDALPTPGLVPLARRSLAPLLQGADQQLIDTLTAYLHHSGATREICEQLFIHRNTLAYRIRRIETLLSVDLGSGQTRATLLLALRLLNRDRTGSRRLDP